MTGLLIRGLSLAGVRRVWEEITLKKASAKKQRNEESIEDETEPKLLDSELRGSSDDSKLTQILNVVTNIQTSQTQHKEEISRIIQDEVSRLRCEFAEKLNLLENEISNCKRGFRELSMKKKTPKANFPLKGLW